jgi:hypothetical protein
MGEKGVRTASCWGLLTASAAHRMYIDATIE